MKSVLPALLLLAMSLPLFAQQPPKCTLTNGVPTNTPCLLFGDDIPDADAAQNVFGVHSNFQQTENDGSVTDLSANAEKHHAGIGLSATDHGAYDSAMQSAFTTGVMPKLADLQKSLSADGYTKLLAYVRAKKKDWHMQTIVGRKPYIDMQGVTQR